MESLKTFLAKFQQETYEKMTPSEYISFIHSILPITKFGFRIQCYSFHRLLRAQFPEARAFYNGNHIITRIDGVFYDIDGIVDNSDGEYINLLEFGLANIQELYDEENLILYYINNFEKTLENVRTD